MKKYTIINGKKYVKYSYLVRNRGECIKYIGEKIYQTLNEEIIFFLDYKTKNEYIIIPSGYEFDFNSSPCFGHCIIDRDEYCIALIHDYLYSKEGKIYKQYKNEGWIFYNYKRSLADKIWREGAIEESKELKGYSNKFKIYLGWIAIRLFGYKHFKK